MVYRRWFKVVGKILWAAIRRKKFSYEVSDSFEIYHAILAQLKENIKMAETVEEKLAARRKLREFDVQYLSFVEEKIKELG